jgi:tripeptide aminopeptidase
MSDRLHETFIDLCRIPSPSRHERAVSQYIRQRAAAYGLRVEEDDAGAVLGSDTGNLLVQTQGVGEPLFLSAHMDTVPPTLVNGQVPVMVDGDRVHTGGRSILGGDDKAGIAVALDMLHEAVQHPHTMRPLDVIFTIQEELGARGADHFDAPRIRARQGFNLDGDTPVGTAIHHAPFKARFYIDVTGRAAHAAVNPEDGINAIKAVAAIAAGLPTGRLDANSIANLGLIEGGGVINVVPAHARLVGEARSLLSGELEALRQRIENTAITEGRAAGATVTFRWEQLYGGYHVPTDSAIARLFRDACAQAGLEAAFALTYGGGDANPYNNKAMTCVVFGLGMTAIHSPDEAISLSDLSQAARILCHACTGRRC